MPYLVLSESASRARIVVIGEDRLMIGRHVDNDVVLNDKAVSGRHALVGRSGADLVLEDLNSTNGVQVNGAAALRHVLVEGDRVVIGRNELVFHDGEPPAAATEAASAEPPLPDAANPLPAPSAPVSAPAPELSLMETAPAAPAEPPRAATPADASELTLIDDATPLPAPRVARLEVLSGAAAGRRLELGKPLNTLGKAGVQVIAVRREHDEHYVLVAVEGPPPLLNDTPMPPGTPTLQPGDVIGLGAVTLRFVLE